MATDCVTSEVLKHVYFCLFMYLVMKSVTDVVNFFLSYIYKDICWTK